MNVLLINPQIPKLYHNRECFIPMNLLYLAGSLEEHGHNVSVLDLRKFNVDGSTPTADFCIQKIDDMVNSFQPDLIGFGCFFSGNLPDMLYFARHTKNKYPKIPIVTGGIHPSLYPTEMLKENSCIDYIVLGEGEETFTDFVNGKKLEDITCIAYRDNGNIVCKGDARKACIEDLDSLPFPAYHLINFSDYYVDTSDWFNPKGLDFHTTVPITTSRGCPFKCNFCVLNHYMGNKWRARSPHNVVDEIEMLYRKYGQRHFSIMEDNFTTDKKRVIDICNEIINRDIDIHFETTNGIHINNIDKEILDAMVDAGLTRITLPIESGNDYIRNKVMHKNVSREKILDVVKLVREHNLFLRVFIIIGVPEETEKSLGDTYNLMREIKPDRIYIHHLTPFYGTEVYFQSVRDGIIVDGRSDFDSVYWMDRDRFFIKPYDLSIEYLKRFHNKLEKLNVK